MAGGHLSGTTGDGGRIVQAGGNIVTSTVHHNRQSGLVVLAALIVAAVAAAGVYAVASDRSGERSAGTSSGPAADSGAQTRSSHAPVPAASPDEQWRGTLLLDTNGGRELDSESPSRAGSLMFAGDIGLGMDGMTWQVLATSGGTIAQWQESGRQPGYAECAAATETAGSAMAPVRQGAVLCVRTDEGRVARLTTTKFPDGLTLSVEFDAVVWELPASGSG
ncbi:hypothetical protein [Streptomyces griseosporeus]|uniref:hypothetical protein n=1 Tax=Streptomyces griseosporeus TaxID=1910 RepID=UPI00379EC63B